VSSVGSESFRYPADGVGLIYWHMLVGTDPDVLTLAGDARRRLARFSGLPASAG
jgi:hypothetical protein